MCTCQINNPQTDRGISHTILCRNTKAGTIQIQYKKKKIYSTGCLDPNDENEDVIIAVIWVHLKIYWAQTPHQNQQCSLQNHCQKNLDPSPHSVLIMTASLIE